jgi:hypothetical protein
MEAEIITKKVVKALKKCGKQGDNKFNRVINLIFTEGINDRKVIAGTLFNNLMRLANEDRTCWIEYDALMNMKKLRIVVDGEGFMVKPVIVNNRMMLYMGKGRYLEASHIFGEEVNVY